MVSRRKSTDDKHVKGGLSWPLYPFILCLYPILFLYSNNVSELSFSQLLIPCIISLAIGVTVFFLLSLITRNRHRSGFFTGLFLIVFFYYSRLFGILETLGMVVPVYRQTYWIVYAIVIFGYAIYFSGKSRFISFGVTRFLNLVFTVLLVVNVFNIGLYFFRVHTDEDLLRHKRGEGFAHAKPALPSIEKPDIYYILLDEYASSETIKDIFEYDNSGFENYLTEKGFYIAKDSRTSNSFTPAAMASVLNMETVIKTGDLNACFNLIRNNKVTNYLKARDYSIINFPIRYYEDKVSPITGSDLTYKSIGDNFLFELSNFNAELIRASILKNWVGRYNYKTKDGGIVYYVNSTEYIFQKLDGLIEKKGPKFIYAHIECPHPPYVFDENGTPFDKLQWDGMKYYLGQYVYMTKKVMGLVDNITNRSKKPPIIIIQSDHGPNQKKKKSRTYFATKINHTKNIFNAILIPGLDPDVLSPDISPENTFRLVFAHTFQENVQLLEN